MSFYGIQSFGPTCTTIGMRQPSATSNEYVYVDPVYGAVNLGNAPPTSSDAPPACSREKKDDCVFQCTSGRYVGFTGNFNDGVKYQYVDVADSIANDVRFMDPRNSPKPYYGAVDGTIGGLGSTRDDSGPSVAVGPLPLYFTDKHYSRRYIPGLAGAKRAVLGTNMRHRLGRSTAASPGC